LTRKDCEGLLGNRDQRRRGNVGTEQRQCVVHVNSIAAGDEENRGYSQVTLPFVLFNLVKIMGELLGIYSKTTLHVCNKI